MLTNEQIDYLILARQAITDRTEDFPNWRAVQYIDAVLATLPEGQRLDVDSLLGRKVLTPADICDLEALTTETARADDYTTATEGHW